MSRTYSGKQQRKAYHLVARLLVASLSARRHTLAAQQPRVVCHAKSTAAEVLGPMPVTALTCAHPPPATQGTRWNRVRPESDSTGMSAKGCNVGGAENLSWFGMSSAARCRTPGASAPRPVHAGDRLHVGITMTVPQSFLARSAPLQHPRCLAVAARRAA